MYHEYFSEFLSQYFEDGTFEELIDSTAAMIAPYVEKDPTKFCTYEEFEDGVAALRDFCLLRAESISGQLDGTIPSTSDGQNADSSSLIDASSVTISDMGSMQNGGGGMGGGKQKHDEKSGSSDDKKAPDDPGNFGDQGDQQIPEKSDNQDAPNDAQEAPQDAPQK
jgi:hypothetical protein